MRICQRPGCGADLDELRADARYCSAACRAAAARQLTNGEIAVVIGPELAFTVSADWPERSARFWAGVDEIHRRRKRVSQPQPAAR